jgi:hypothetical protein
MVSVFQAEGIASTKSCELEIAGEETAVTGPFKKGGM